MANKILEEPGRSALLDVTWSEPLDKNSLQYKIVNIFLTSHIAGSMGREVQRMGEFIVKELQRFMAGEKRNA